MATLDDYVVITITRQTAGITAPGFGIPLILGYGATWGDRLRYYSDLPSIAGDGFSTDSPEYLAAQAILSQNPSVTQLAIGKGLLKPTLKYQIGAALIALDTYQLLVDGQGVTETTCSFTAGAAPNLAQVHSALVTQLNAVVGKNYTAALAPLGSLAAQIFTANSVTSQFTKANHGLLTGDGPVQVSNSGGALPAGLAAATNYFIIAIDVNTFQLATSLPNALAGTFVPITTNGTGTQTETPQAGALSPALPFTVLASAAGNWFSLTVGNPALLSNAMIHADPGVATDLNAIVASQPNWYGLTTIFNSQQVVVNTAAWTEGNERIYSVAVPETLALTTVGGDGGTGDTMDALHTQNFSRTIAAYHQDPNQFMGAAWLGIMLPFDPGSATWKFKTLAEVDFTTFTPTQRANLLTRSGNGMENVGGLSITFEGTSADGEFLDAIVGDDWVKATMQAAIFNTIAGAPGKVEFEDSGIALVENAIRQILRLAQDRKIYAKTPDFTLVVPLASSVLPVDKASRTLPDIIWTATRSGAIHKVKVQGTVSL